MEKCSFFVFYCIEIIIIIIITTTKWSMLQLRILFYVFETGTILSKSLERPKQQLEIFYSDPSSECFVSCHSIVLFFIGKIWNRKYFYLPKWPISGNDFFFFLEMTWKVPFENDAEVRALPNDSFSFFFFFILENKFHRIYWEIKRNVHGWFDVMIRKIQIEWIWIIWFQNKKKKKWNE